MGKLLKYGGIAWTIFGVFALVELMTVSVRDSGGGSDTLGASEGIAMLLVVAIFIFPGLKLASRGHKLLQGDAKVALRAADVARKFERDETRAEPVNALPRVERPCPYCAEPILAQAIVCKHCGRDVPPVPRRELGIRG